MSSPRPAPAIGQELAIDEQVAIYQREFPTVDPQVETIVSTLSRVARRMGTAYGRQLTVLGITSAEWEVLKALVVAGSPYQLGPGELAKRLGLTPAAMTHRIDRMVAEDLVTRERDESNRVRVIIELTANGRDKWLESMRMAAVFEEELLQDIVGEERAVLSGMLARMLRRIEDGNR
ncbi:DNA-binding MarR family transcriptional regulator [Kitasatospora sp. MAP12-15]|uniref:MarR family winged helix-turn-helix transcriptional regulator n=1 Tax=unclassified Kitasatospora TaxID=2633591 RepID=UPI00247589F8|nr:MarR family transcriptional regulator [Kitasatospora sp. MAP12-44]MDH6110297.1 DNA-binding MarR family transcriptional regulator [Kitasatospora sp. MAP12-44]